MRWAPSETRVDDFPSGEGAEAGADAPDCLGAACVAMQLLLPSVGVQLWVEREAKGVHGHPWIRPVPTAEPARRLPRGGSGQGPRLAGPRDRAQPSSAATRRRAPPPPRRLLTGPKRRLVPGAFSTTRLSSLNGGVVSNERDMARTSASLTSPLPRSGFSGRCHELRGAGGGRGGCAPSQLQHSGRRGGRGGRAEALSSCVGLGVGGAQKAAERERRARFPQRRTLGAPHHAPEAAAEDFRSGAGVRLAPSGLLRGGGRHGGAGDAAQSEER